MMHKNRKHRKIAAFFLLGACVLIFFILNICIGSVRIALPDVARIFSGQESNGTVTRILWDIRLPRAIAVLLLGGALSLAGYLLQAEQLYAPSLFHLCQKSNNHFSHLL